MTHIFEEIDRVFLLKIARNELDKNASSKERASVMGLTSSLERMFLIAL